VEIVIAIYISLWTLSHSIGGTMPKYNIDYFERVNNYWNREIEAENSTIAQTLFLEEIQGTEPDHVDRIGYGFEDGEEC
jgi:hypothetical protein